MSSDFDDQQRVVFHPNGRYSVTLWAERNWPDNDLAEWPSRLSDSYFSRVVYINGHAHAVSREVADEIERLAGGEVSPRGTEALPDGMAEKLRGAAALIDRLTAGAGKEQEVIDRLRAWADALDAGVRQHRDTPAPTREEAGRLITAAIDEEWFSSYNIGVTVADALIARGWLAVSDGVDPQTPALLTDAETRQLNADLKRLADQRRRVARGGVDPQEG